MNEVDFPLWRLGSGFRFLLECVDHQNIRVDPDGVGRTKGVTAIPQGDLEYSPINALERLGLVRLPALSSDGKCVEHVALNVFGEILEIPPGSLDPGNISGVSHADIYVNTPQAPHRCQHPGNAGAANLSVRSSREILTRAASFAISAHGAHL